MKVKGVRIYAWPYFIAMVNNSELLELHKPDIFGYLLVQKSTLIENKYYLCKNEHVK